MAVRAESVRHSARVAAANRFFMVETFLSVRGVDRDERGRGARPW